MSGPGAAPGEVGAAEPDHLVVGCDTLERGAAWARAALGAEPAPGGAHPGRGTHNLLLGLGPALYLEIIAPDPAQPEPAAPRAFGLDLAATREALLQGPALLSFVARTPFLGTLLRRLGDGAGRAEPMSRGALRWLFAAPDDPAGGVVPCLIEWPGNRTVARVLPDSGWRLAGLTAEHPEPDRIRRALAGRGLAAVAVRAAPAPALLAELDEPGGGRVRLSSPGSG